MPAPLLLLDVDGVLSLFGPRLDVRSGGRWVMVDGLAHFLSEEAGRHLRALGDDFELAWCTGWEERANDHLPHAFGLPSPLPTVLFPDPPEDHAHWKLAGIDAFARAERPLAWIDDAHDESCHRWAAARVGPTKLVTVASDLGLRNIEAEALRRWAAELSATGSPGGSAPR